jgi:signal transduction histidine kinase
MRWRFARRRLSVYAPRVGIGRRRAWPLSVLVGALALGFGAALALWAFELGRDLMIGDRGVERLTRTEGEKLQGELAQIRIERDKAQSIANTAESLLMAERTTLERLTQQLKQIEGDAQTLREDLAFYERLLPAPGEGIAIRAFRVEQGMPGRLSYQMLVAQSGRGRGEFVGRYDFSVFGTQAGKPWNQAAIGGARNVSMRQSARLEGMIDVPSDVVVKVVQARLMDASGAVKSSQQARF